EIGYPGRESERQALNQHRSGEPVEKLAPVMTGADLVRIQARVRDVKVDESINDYLLDLVEGSRSHPDLELGISTRGALTFYRALQSLAYLEGRDYVVPDDVKTLAVPVFAHRVQCRGVLREGQRQRAAVIIRQLLQQVSVPD